MKKTLAVGVIGAALATAALLGASPASASSKSFLSALHQAGWYNRSFGDSGLLRTGREVCNFLYQGYSEYAVINHVYNTTNSSVSLADAGQFVAIAQDHLC